MAVPSCEYEDVAVTDLPRSASLATVGTYEIIYWFNPFEPRATTSWAVSFLIGVTRQHGLHRMLTFTHQSPYWPSLGRA
jgi:hypothetical protein